MQKVKVLAPAKLNLTLEVTGKRADGYHLVDMWVQTVDLFEEITLEIAEGFSFTCSDKTLPAGGENLAVKAANAFFEAANLPCNIAIKVEKCIPVGAGMAGGSADAAGVLVGLNKLHGDIFTEEKLEAIGATLGADVPFAMCGGTARLTGIGTEIKQTKPLPPCFFVVCMPKCSAATAGVYKRYDETGPGAVPDNAAAEKAINCGNLKALASCMGNALQKASGGESTEDICGILKESGALAAQMTGSGAAVFGIYEDEKTAIKAMESLWPKYKKSYFLKPVNHGPLVYTLK